MLEKEPSERIRDQQETFTQSPLPPATQGDWVSQGHWVEHTQKGIASVVGKGSPTLNTVLVPPAKS